MTNKKLGTMIAGAHSGGAKVMVRVASHKDRAGAQQALDLGADGVMFPTVNNAQEAALCASIARYPTQGTRSVYHPQPSNVAEGLLPSVGGANARVLVIVQIETADGAKNVEDIAKVDGVDMLFLGPNDFCMSAGLYEKYKFPDMYSSPELNAATDALLAACRKHNKLPGVFVFGTEKVPHYLSLGFNFISVGNDLHHVMTAAQGHLDKVKEVLASKGKGPAPSGVGAGAGSTSSGRGHGAAQAAANDDAWTQVQTVGLERKVVTMRRATPSNAKPDDPFAETAFDAVDEGDEGILRGRKSTARMGAALLRDGMGIVGEGDGDRDFRIVARKSTSAGRSSGANADEDEDERPINSSDAPKRRTLVQRVLSIGKTKGKAEQPTPPPEDPNLAFDSDLAGVSSMNPMFGQR